MYFAIDSRAPKMWLDDLLHDIAGASSVNWFALVDGAFDHGTKPFAASVRCHPLYGETSVLSELLPASPYLLPLDGMASTGRRAMVEALGTHCQGRPMLSFVASGQSAERLVELWQPCLQPVVVGDDTQYLLRFADTRVLAALPGALSPEAWDRLTVPLLTWCYVNREGVLETLPLTEPRSEPKTYPTEPLRLSQVELDRMVEAAMPDSILDFLHRDDPDSLPLRDKAGIHRLVVRACVLAREHRIESIPDIVALASHALITGDAGLRVPELLALLNESGRSPGELGERLLSVRKLVVTESDSRR
ncbi:conserved hypothetical protein [Cupriavidus taiwanensis]|uniref:DUF4123 domain-containing protein n=1 Tax=Cupriavidus taiwanensis TaxID=164546 RepID=A0A976AUA3_9BURK|nr:DUF4123 domain-containing protein [Cupriavidus taiwanensis]SOZ51290.1 conserved hypothetical protein [Cupriavidus taiwanensis]SOZ53169.1 conserved hypothetical protein [Cupriavidus taiwanensis]SOZ54970.1 conserved hypothetical protein [Cupriavidus taiwanensis]SPA05345.1 conserved hypothetical protein [Cupriavidus taiwanensis]